MVPFSRDKLLLSIYKSCSHRSNALGDAAALTDTVIKRILKSAKDGPLDSRFIKQTVQVALNRFDKVASVHYQAFHS